MWRVTAAAPPLPGSATSAPADGRSRICPGMGGGYSALEHFYRGMWHCEVTPRWRRPPDPGRFFFFFGCIAWHAESLFLDQGLNLCPLQRKCRVLATGPPENPSTHFFFLIDIHFKIKLSIMTIKKYHLPQVRGHHSNTYN